jgi:5-methylcytosine-specific restriction endonuclease McrBC regulatory subunit McrC
MNKVYEDFVTTLVEEIINEDKDFQNYVVEKQKRFDSLVIEEAIITKPDVILRRKDSLDDYPLIIDAKYKSEGHNADYYQVIAYSLAIPTAKSCCLIYPETEPVHSQLTLVKNPADPKSKTVKLYAITVNLDRDLEFNEYIKEIKKDLKLRLLRCLV